MKGRKKTLSYFMCKEMLYEYVTNNLGSRKNDFIASLSEYPELELDIKKLKAAIEFSDKLSGFSIQPKFIDEIKRPTWFKSYLDYVLNTPIWVKVVFVLLALSIPALLYIQPKSTSSLLEVEAKDVTQPGTQFVQRQVQKQVLRYSLEPNSGDNLTGLIEKKILELNAKPTPEAPLWKKETGGVLFTFTIDRVDFSVFEEYAKDYGVLLNLNGTEPDSIDQASYNVELLLKTKY